MQKKYIVLIIIGLIQPLGMLFDLPQVRAIGTFLAASPLPLVFSHFRGLETFSSKFTVKLKLVNGEMLEKKLDPKNYSLLKGPYNRRNVYGAVAAYGPVLTEKKESILVASVLQYAFCRGALLEPLNIKNDLDSAKLLITNNISPKNFSRELGVKCLVSSKN